MSWFFTTGGFYSVVQHRDKPDVFLVRARDKASLETMLEGIELAGNAEGVEHEVGEIFMAEGGSDYPWRVEVPKATYAIFVVHELLNYTNYPNFKSELKQTRGEKWEEAAMDVWVAMHKVEDTKEHRKWLYSKKAGGKGSENEDWPMTQEEIDRLWAAEMEPTDEELEILDAQLEIESGQGERNEGKN